MVTMQRDLIAEFKRETFLNVGLMSKLQAMPIELSKIFKENALEKPTQNLFNHLTHYLIGIIDPRVPMSWPLYDTKTERVYRNEVSCFINDFSGKGLLSPVMSSYLVNPGCFKVTFLMFQLSQLALQKLLKSKMKDNQKNLYNDMTEEYKSSENENFLERIEKETDNILSKFTTYPHRRKAMESITEKLRMKISEMESRLLSTNAQNYINNLVDGFINKNSLDDCSKLRIQQIKNVKEPAMFFDQWLSVVDEEILKMESKWSEKVTPLLQLCADTKYSTESLISRHTGEAEQDSYMIEYNHHSDEICTKDLQNHVNSQQKYILKNIVKDEKLDFPNMIRAFLIAISFTLKNAEIGDEIYKFNEHFEGGARNYSELVGGLKGLVERVMNAEANLQPSPLTYHRSITLKDNLEIPPLPDLSDLHCTRELQCQALFDTFTPLSMSKHQFNLHRKNLHDFSKSKSRLSKELLVTPFFNKPKDDFMSFISSHAYDRPFVHNLSIASNNRANETIAECSTGFTKQQILRLLSTKKSSTKKFNKYKTERHENFKKGRLFNESSSSTESLIRSYSSPNLFENRDRSRINARRRKLSIMEEHSPTNLDVSGIVALDKDSFETSQGTSAKKTDINLPLITLTEDGKFNDIIKDFHAMNKEVLIDSPKEIEGKTETPKNTQLISKTSSLEKIINRFKKVRASVITVTENQPNCLTIAEEKENFNRKVHINEKFKANRILLPDLLSPSYSVLKKSNVDESRMDFDDNVCKTSRDSLGAALGVDQTFLDQFDY